MESEASDDHLSHQQSYQLRLKQENPDTCVAQFPEIDCDDKTDRSLSPVKQEINIGEYCLSNVTDNSEEKLKDDHGHGFVSNELTLTSGKRVKVENNQSDDVVDVSSSESARPGCSEWPTETKREVRIDVELKVNEGREDCKMDIDDHVLCKYETWLDRHVDCEERSLPTQTETRGQPQNDDNEGSTLQFERRNENGRRYKCKHCHYVANHRSSLFTHTRVKHDPNARLYKCTRCDFTTKLKATLVTHVKRTHDPNAEIYKCAECDYTTKTMNNLARHVSVRHDVNTEIHKCAKCDFTTKTKQYLLKHFRAFHDLGADLFRCSACDYVTKWRHHLTLHVKTKHDADVKVYKCPDCGYTTKWKRDLGRHWKTKHDGNAELHECDMCDYVTKWKAYLVSHTRLKHGVGAQASKHSD